MFEKNCRSKGKLANAKIPAQLLLLQCRNKKQWAEDHFERLENDDKFHNIIFTKGRTGEEARTFPRLLFFFKKNKAFDLLNQMPHCKNGLNDSKRNT